MPDLILGTTTTTDQPIGITGGTGITLPSATTSLAGLMSAADKGKVDNSIQQGGNSFGTDVLIASNDGNGLNFKTGGAIKGSFDAATNNFYVSSLANQSNVNNSLIALNNNGTSITSNKPGGDTTLNVNNANQFAVGNIQTWQFNNSTKSYIKPDGSFKADNGLNGTTVRVDAPNSNLVITASPTTGWARGLLVRNSTDNADLACFAIYGTSGTSYTYGYMGTAFNNATLKFNNAGIGIKLSGTTAPAYPLHLDIGTVTGANVLGYFGQNGGSVKIANSSGTAGEFNPSIIGTANNVSDVGLGFTAQGSNSYTTAAFSLKALDAAIPGPGPVLGGNTFLLANNTTPQLIVDYTGVVTIPTLAGTGTQMVTADSSGNLSAISTVPVANGGTGLTSAGTNGQILVSDGTGFVLTTPPEISAGTYNPTITGGATSYTASGFRFTRLGPVVHVGGCVSITGANVGSNTFILDLPVNTTVSNLSDVTGVVSGLSVGSPKIAGESNNVQAYFSTPGMASVSFIAVDVNPTPYLEFTYIVQ